MESVLIAGIESVVGSNLAAALASRYRIFGLSFSESFSLSICDTDVCSATDADAISRWVSSIAPDRIVYCGGASLSNWQTREPHISDVESDLAGTVKNWAKAARDFDCLLTYISSDAVFTGPWMFHKEDGSGQCESQQAESLRLAENVVLQTAPDALVVRTNVYGWSPQAAGQGWIEQILKDLDSDCSGPFDYLRHATPILASDFATILAQAWENSLAGVYHIAGAERVNPNQFVERLADEFRLPEPSPVDGNCLWERPTGFGCGECSLHTNKIRKAVNTAMPTLADGLRRLREQQLSGYCARLSTEDVAVHEKIA